MDEKFLSASTLSMALGILSLLPHSLGPIEKDRSCSLVRLAFRAGLLPASEPRSVSGEPAIRPGLVFSPRPPQFICTSTAVQVKRLKLCACSKPHD